jgi:hypothetical protein
MTGSVPVTVSYGRLRKLPGPFSAGQTPEITRIMSDLLEASSSKRANFDQESPSAPRWRARIGELTARTGKRFVSISSAARLFCLH